MILESCILILNLKNMQKNKTYQLNNKNGITVEFISYGARLKSVLLPDGDKKTDIILGYETTEEFETGDPYLNAICGRYANRIANSKFELNGKTYQLKANDGKNFLHGGDKGFHQKYWEVKPIELEGYESAFKLSAISEDGEENFPGNLKVDVIYALNYNNELLIDIKAATDKETVLNLTSHPYFNLNGKASDTIHNHDIKVNADHYTELNNENIPTGNIVPVEGLAMDLRSAKQFSEVVDSEYPEIKMREGFDHNWVLNKDSKEPEFAGSIELKEKNRAVEVYTTQPGLQVYTGMHFDGSSIGKENIAFNKYAGIALEAQNFADAMNHENFPNCRLKPDEEYHERIIYKFKY